MLFIHVGILPQSTIKNAYKNTRLHGRGKSHVLAMWMDRWASGSGLLLHVLGEDSLSVWKSAQGTCSGAFHKVDRVTVPYKKDSMQWCLFSPWCIRAAYELQQEKKTQEWNFKRKQKKRKNMRNRIKKKETKHNLLLYSYGDNKNCGCRKWKLTLFKETKCAYMLSHQCVSSDLRAYLATGTLAIYLLPQNSRYLLGGVDFIFLFLVIFFQWFKNIIIINS